MCVVAMAMARSVFIIVLVCIHTTWKAEAEGLCADDDKGYDAVAIPTAYAKFMSESEWREFGMD